METGKIYQAMANVYAKVEAIGKEQTNTQQGFKFRGIDDVYNALHRIFAEEKIFVMPERVDVKREEITSNKGTKGFSTVSTIKFTFYTIDGSSVAAIVDGESADYGDKSTSKSQSMAIKYALLQTFMIPTEDTEDADKHAVGDMLPSGDLKSALTAISRAASIVQVADIVKFAEEKRAWKDGELKEIKEKASIRNDELKPVQK